MLTHDEKRDYIRMDIDCEIIYKPAGSDDRKTGKCLNLSGAGISFLAERDFDTGLAMEVSIIPKTNITPPMTAFIEVVRSSRQKDGSFEIAAVIKSIKGN